MTDRLFVDTNVLVYSLDPSAPEKRLRASALLRSGVARGWLVTSPQTLNECYRVLTRKRRLMPALAARQFLWTISFTCKAQLDRETTAFAWRIEDSTGYGWWDCLMLAAAVRADCRVFATEDLEDGRLIAGMRVANPFVHDLTASA